MAYNRWLSGSQYYQPNDVLHYGRKGMKWGKHIFGIPESLFRKLNFGSKLDPDSLQTLLQRGEIDFNAFKQLSNRQNVMNQLMGQMRSPGNSSNTVREHPTQGTAKRSGQAMKSIGDSVANNAKARKADEDKYRQIAEEKARMGRQDEAKTVSEKAVKEVAKKTASSATKTASRKSTTSANKTQTQSQRQTETTTSQTSKPYTSNVRPSSDPGYTKETDDERFERKVNDYFENYKSEQEADREREKAERLRQLEEQRDTEIKDEERKWLRTVGKIAKFVNRLVHI